MSKLPLDLSKFKKTECDDDFTTLKHDNGHIIKVCHGGLTGKLKSDLEKMPLHKAKGGMVKGYSGESDDPSDSQVTSSDAPPAHAPVTINLGIPGAQQNVAPSGVPDALSAPGQMGVNQNTGVPDALSPDASQTTPPPAQDQQAQVAPDAGTGQKQEQLGGGDEEALKQLTDDFDVHQAAADHINAQDQQLKGELASGQINPKDYQKVFNDESTPGKIGTLFGLLVGGIGSGLTHQPNAVMQMMDKTIQNDNAAQSKNIEFAQKLKEINNQTLTATAGAKFTSAQADVMTDALRQTQKTRMAFATIADQASKLPEGPLKQSYMAQLQSLAPILDAHNANIADLAAGRASLLTGGPGGAGDEEATFTQRQKGLQQMGPWGQTLSNFETDRHIAGIPGIGKQLTNRAVTGQERDQLNAQQVLDQKGRDLLSFAKQHEGSWSPATRAVADQKAQEMVNFYNSSVGGGILTEGRLKWLDDQVAAGNPTSIIGQELYGSQERLNEIINSNVNRRNQKLSSLGIKMPSSGGSSMEGKTAVNNKGQRIQYTNGKWGPVQ